MQELKKESLMMNNQEQVGKELHQKKELYADAFVSILLGIIQIAYLRNLLKNNLIKPINNY